MYGLDARGLPFRLLKRQWNNRIDYIRYGEGVWLDEVYSGYGGLDVSPEREGKVYFVQNRKVQAFDMTTRQVTDTGIAYGTGFRSTGWVRFPDDPELPGETLVTINSEGRRHCSTSSPAFIRRCLRLPKGNLHLFRLWRKDRAAKSIQAA